jgi:ABC-type sugar transport system ATPase subunit
MADRILVFRNGRIAAEFARAGFDREAILLAAAHVARNAAGPIRAA